MEANQPMGDNEFNKFIKITQSRQIDFNQILREKYSKGGTPTDLEILNEQLHHIQLQKFHELYHAFKKHR